MHLSYVVAAGERNRALTVVKSRGTAHSNQVRELFLSRQGIGLAEVDTAGGEVLMGTLRFEKEEQERAESRRRESAVADRVATLEAELEESAVRLRALESGRRRRLEELHRVRAQADAERQRGRDATEAVRRLRTPGKKKKQ